MCTYKMVLYGITLTIIRVELTTIVDEKIAHTCIKYKEISIFYFSWNSKKFHPLCNNKMLLLIQTGQRYHSSK